jgi:hypothetical protein
LGTRRAHVPAAVYRDAWPGIDVRFSGIQRRLEYAMNVAPGADAGAIGLRMSGASSVKVQRDGNLLARLRGGATIRELAPLAYRTSSDGHRQIVPSRDTLHGGTVRITLGAYDRSRALVVDPTVDYSTYLGGANGDAGTGIAVDSSGGAYVAGSTASTDFPTRSAYQATNGFDNFCLYAGWGIRAGYPTAGLSSLPPSTRRAVRGRMVIALTANPFYALDGARPGQRLAEVSKRLKPGKVLRMGANDWYVAAGRSAAGVVKVRGGVIQEVGLANRRLTRDARRPVSPAQELQRELTALGWLPRSATGP